MPMKKRTSILYFLLSTFLGCGSVNVADLEPGDFENLGLAACDGVESSFSINVVPIFSAQGCTNGDCHSDMFRAGSLNLDVAQVDGVSGVRSSILDGRVDEGVSADSKILTKPLGLNSHGGGEIFSGTTDDDYLTIFCWIASGAADD
jgi:hypothetical protein